ncbi:hypothetical protein ACYSNR_14265 [Enterococcus sp. LJL128]
MAKTTLKLFATFSLILLFIGCEKKQVKTSQTTFSEKTIQYTEASTNTVIPSVTLKEKKTKSYEDLKKLPYSTEKQDLSNLSMVILFQSNGFKTRESNDDFVADIKNKNFYLYPWEIEKTKPDWDLSTDDIEEIKTILEDCNVQEWKEKYGEEKNPTATADRGIWNLLLVFENSTIESHSGYSPDTDEPAELDTLHEKLMDFRDQKRQEWQKENAN